MKTIRQMADELGVDKQKVYRFIVRNGITASGEVKQSKLYDESVERLINSHFHHISTSGERCGEVHQKSDQEHVLEQLVKELEAKNEQIREKDRQLNAALEMLAENQKLLDQQQQLNAMAEHRIKLLEQKRDDIPAPDVDGQSQPPDAEGKKGFFNRIFRL